MAKKMKIDFSGVDEEIRKGGKSKHIPEGDYLMKVVSGEVQGQDEGKARINWRFQVVKGPEKGATIYGSTSLKPQALWNLRNLIHAAMGKNVAGKAVNFDPETLYGKIVGVTVEDNAYTKDGKEKITSQASTFFPKDEIGKEEEEEDDDETEEVEEEDDDDLEDMDVEDL